MSTGLPWSSFQMPKGVRNRPTRAPNQSTGFHSMYARSMSRPSCRYWSCEYGPRVDVSMRLELPWDWMVVAPTLICAGQSDA